MQRTTQDVRGEAPVLLTAHVGARTTAGRLRTVVESVTPSVDHGRFPVKRVIGEPVDVEADVFTDGHDAVACDLLHREPGMAEWRRTPMRPLGNDRWTARFTPMELGTHEFAVEGWVDPFETWRRELRKRRDAGEDLTVPLQVGEALVRAAAARAGEHGQATLGAAAARLADPAEPVSARLGVALADALALAVRALPDPETIARPEVVHRVTVDPVRARYSTWYELFPRSTGPAGTHGTFRTCIERLPYVARLGFDVLYLPPIHPIGVAHRKGRNNTTTALPDDVGSPWAIGGADGGHDAIHPDLGTMDDFRALVAAARAHGIDLALDIAFQASPDHPWVKAHPEWFRHRPDGSIQYAENPPKKYQDIYPFHFESEAWLPLWEALADVVAHWANAGVRVFRVDNPHTKPFALWEWLIARIKSTHPETIFLSEAFTRPRVMHRLAKAGFTQSYTYFTWRNTKHELTEYFTELATGPGREYFRPNVWPNTPDILPEPLQYGGRPAYMVRLVLAATLAASYGIYGPAFELMESAPREPGSEEYLDSEKYQLRSWDLDRPDSLAELIARVNRIRRDEPALQSDRSLAFHPIDNDRMIAYSKVTETGEGVLVVVNLDPHNRQTGWIDVPLERFGLEGDRPYQMHDLLSGARYLWSGSRNFIGLDPATHPAHVFRIRRRLRREQDFDYFL